MNTDHFLKGGNILNSLARVLIQGSNRRDRVDMFQANTQDLHSPVLGLVLLLGWVVFIPVPDRLDRHRNVLRRFNRAILPEQRRLVLRQDRLYRFLPVKFVPRFLMSSVLLANITSHPEILTDAG